MSSNPRGLVSRRRGASWSRTQTQGRQCDAAEKQGTAQSHQELGVGGGGSLPSGPEGAQPWVLDSGPCECLLL